MRAGAYRRSLRLPGGRGIAELRPTPGYVACRLMLSDLSDLTSAIARCRWLLDLDADPVAVDEVLGADPELAPLVAKAPGRRVPRCVDGAELAVRAVVGQQVSTAAARTLSARMVAACGEALVDGRGGLTHLFPTAEALRGVEMAMPAGRHRALEALVDALSTGRLALGPGADRAEAMATMARMPGLGPWTTEVIAMRALGDPDAFPVSDLGVRRGAESLGLPATSAALEARSRSWRPWRAYAVQYLWSLSDHPINHWPVKEAS